MSQAKFANGNYLTNPMIAVINRFYVTDPMCITEHLNKLSAFLDACFTCQQIDRVYIAVNTARDIANTIAVLADYHPPVGKTLTTIPVCPWGALCDPSKRSHYPSCFRWI